MREFTRGPRHMYQEFGSCVKREDSPRLSPGEYRVESGLKLPCGQVETAGEPLMWS